MAVRPYPKAGKLLREDPFAPCYYFVGPVDLLKDEAVSGLVDRALGPATRDFNFDQRSAAELDAETLETLCSTVPMMAARRVVVVRDVEAWARKRNLKAAILRYLARPSPETVLILVQGAAEPKPDPEVARQAEVVTFDPLDGRTAEVWLSRRAATRGITLEPDASRLLLSATQGDLGWLAAELDKLAGLGEGPISVAEVERQLGIRHGETARDWIGAVFNDEPARAVAMLSHLLAQPGSSGVRLVSQLGTHLIGVALTRARHDRGMRGKRLEGEAFALIREARLWGVPWADTARDWASWASAWPAARLRAALRVALQADTALKSTTVSDERGILTDLVLQLALARREAA